MRKIAVQQLSQINCASIFLQDHVERKGVEMRCIRET